eukprot:gene48944-59925_t
MPLSGKTSLGKKLRKIVPFPVFDLDAELETFTQKSIAAIFFQYSQKQLDSLDKLIERTRNQEMRTADGKRIQAEQLARFAEIRQKLQDNLHEVKNQQPYIK